MTLINLIDYESLGDLQERWQKVQEIKKASNVALIRGNKEILHFISSSVKRIYCRTVQGEDAVLLLRFARKRKGQRFIKF